MARERATFAAGCFWGVEVEFRNVVGVLEAQVGYTGGTKPQPNYKEVCTGSTGHAEAVDLWFDPAQVSYDRLLDVFWDCHDPTQVNRQGPDVGTQYRSAIFTHSPAQATAAEASRERLQQRLGSAKRVATRIEPAAEFWPAEEYHQQYLVKRGQATCRI